jgi:hypothetical protein
MPITASITADMLRKSHRRQRDHPDRLGERSDGGEHRVAGAHERQQIGRRRQAGGAEGRAARGDLALEIHDLYELVEADERRRARGDFQDAQRRGRVVRQRGHLGLGQREDLVVNPAEDHAAERPVGAECRDRQHQPQHHHVHDPQAGPEAERPHPSVGSASPSR